MSGTPSTDPAPVLRTLIVDDEPLARSVLRRLIAQHDQVELEGEARSGREALDRLDQGGIDLVLLDIQMPELTGLELLELLESKGLADANVSFVFVTAYDRYAVRAFETQAVDYLLKPVTPQRFEKAIAKVLTRRQDANPVQVQQLLADALITAPTRFLVRRGDHIVPVQVEDIDWVEASGDYVRLHCGERSFLIERTLQRLEEMLQPLGFRRIHRGTLVNESRIKRLRPLGSGRYQLELVDGTELTVSRSYSADVRALVL